MRLNDEAVSELLGYTVLVAVVSIAAIGLLAGSMGALSISEKRMEYAGAISALKSFEKMVSDAAEVNNTYYAAFEMSVPSGCDLAVNDEHDDFRSLSIYSGSGQLAFLPMGSATLRSPFRTVAFEGGAVISNDTGQVKAERSPAVRMVTTPSGKKALYMSVISISCDSFTRRTGPLTLLVKCSSVKPMSWHIPDGTVVSVRARSGDPQAWKEQLEECGLTTAYGNGEVLATSGEVSEIYVVYAEADVKAGG